MTEQELRDELSGIAYDLGYTRASDLDSLVAIANTYAAAQVKAERARAEKLVEALERAKYACESGNQYLGCEKLPNGYGYKAVPDTAYEAICLALAAYKKGGTNEH